MNSVVKIEDKTGFPSLSYNKKFTSAIDMFNAQGKNVKLADSLPCIIPVVAYTVNSVAILAEEDVVDHETGQVIYKKGEQTDKRAPQIIIISATGEAYRTSAGSAIRRLGSLFQLFDLPESWSEPIYLAFTKESAGSKNWFYGIEIVDKEMYELQVENEQKMKEMRKKKVSE